MILKCFKQSGSLFRPERLVFDEPEKGIPRKILENVPGLGGIFESIFSMKDFVASVGGTMAETGKILALSLGKLAVSFSTLIDLATYGIAQGTVEAIDGFKQLINWIKHHKEMQEPKDLDEYSVIRVLYLKGLSYKEKGDSKLLTEFKRNSFNIAILDILLQQVKTFYEPVMKEIERVDREITFRDRLEYENRGTMLTLQGEVDNLNALINGGHLSTASKEQFTIERNLKMRSLAQLKQNSDKKNVKWKIPQVQETEFPIGSGRFIRRFIPGKTEVTVDLDKLRNELNIYAIGAVPFMQMYFLEKAKYMYRREEILEKDSEKLSDVEKINLSAYEARLGVAKDAAKVHFNKNLDPAVTPSDAGKDNIEKKNIEPLYYLVNNAFQLRKTTVNTPQAHQNYVLWKYSGKIPKNLVEFGCYKDPAFYTAANPARSTEIVKKSSSGSVWKFTIEKDGSVKTGFPDGPLKTLPPNEYPGRKDAWSPPMP